MNTNFKRTYCLEQRTFEITIDAHDFACRLHLRTERTVCIHELIKRPAWEFHDTVVKCGFETCFRFLSDRVRDFIERIADGNFCGDLGDGIASCLGSKCRGTAHAGIDFDHIVAVAIRIESILRVAAAFDSEFANDTE